MQQYSLCKRRVHMKGTQRHQEACMDEQGAPDKSIQKE